MSLTHVEPDAVERLDDKALIRKLHVNHAAHFLYHNLMSLAYVGLMAASVWTWMHGHWPWTLVCWAVGGHVGHAKLIAFHEASHGTLNARRWVNELQGIGIGTVILVPLSVYRYVHGQHHTYLAQPRDLELWPFVAPGTPRVFRLLAAAAELFVGFFYTPFLFLHGVLVGRNIPKSQRWRIKVEYVLCAVVWIVLFVTLTMNNWWEAFIVGYLVPATIAGNLQSLRKFTEHMGLTGDSILTVTRTVVDPHLVGNFLSESMLHIDYHGTHHRYAKLPYYNLPAATPYVFAANQPALPIYPNYASAVLDMLRTLGNPRVGKQWEEQTP